MEKIFKRLFNILNRITVSAIVVYIATHAQGIINKFVWWLKQTFKSRSQKAYEEYCQKMLEAEEYLSRCKAKMERLDSMKKMLDDREADLDEREERIIEAEKRLGISEEVVEI